MAVEMRTVVLWFVTLRSLVAGYKRFRGIECRHLTTVYCILHISN
jgi:hypothetical protein